MTVQCARCANFTLQYADGRSGTELSKQGYGTCKHIPGRGNYQSDRVEPHCAKFAETDKTTIIKRVNWLSARRQEFENTIRATQAKESK